MSDQKGIESHPDPTGDGSTGGLNLILVYSLIAVALLAAIVIALFIVLPFYHRH
jgi:hypothetical protein